MADPHYTPSGTPVSGSKGQSSAMRAEFDLIEAGIQVMNSIPFLVTHENLNTTVPADQSHFVAVPWAGNIVGAYAVNQADNATNPTVLTLEIGGTAVTMPTWEFGSTDVAGTVISSVPTALNVLAAGEAVEIITDGGGSSSMPGAVTLLIERT